jgi:hypothetical protein
LLLFSGIRYVTGTLYGKKHVTGTLYGKEFGYLVVLITYDLGPWVLTLTPTLTPTLVRENPGYLYA